VCGIQVTLQNHNNYSFCYHTTTPFLSIVSLNHGIMSRAEIIVSGLMTSIGGLEIA